MWLEGDMERRDFFFMAAAWDGDLIVLFVFPARLGWFNVCPIDTLIDRGITVIVLILACLLPAGSRAAITGT